MLANGRELDWDWSRVNVNGGAIALGHPIGSSGSRVLTTLIYELRRRGRWSWVGDAVSGWRWCGSDGYGSVEKGHELVNGTPTFDASRACKRNGTPTFDPSPLV